MNYFELRQVFSQVRLHKTTIIFDISHNLCKPGFALVIGRFSGNDSKRIRKKYPVAFDSPGKLEEIPRCV